MNLLDVDQLFYTCPYPVKYDGAHRGTDPL